MSAFKLYCLTNKSHRNSYVGIAKDLTVRLEQHNGKKAGGAKATKPFRGEWKIAFYVIGFANDTSCRCLEHWMHGRGPGQHLPAVRGVKAYERRRKHLEYLVGKYPDKFGNLQVLEVLDTKVESESSSSTCKPFEDDDDN